MDVLIYGADSETLHGEPMTLQFFSKDVKLNELHWVNKKTAQRTFLAFCNRLQRDCLHVVYVHNLDFDLPEFLWGSHSKLIGEGSGEYKFKLGAWHVSGVYGKPTYCVMRNANRRVTTMLVDSHSWYQGALAKAAELFCPQLPKLKYPKGLGSVQFKRSDVGFRKYAMRDAEICYYIGKYIQRIHTEFDIRQSVSLAQMAERIFRHKFLDYTIPQPASDIIHAALASYHGGKNNVIPGAAPAWHVGVSAFDISSAFPYAMAQLPSMRHVNLYKRYPKRIRGASRIKKVPWLGVYQVSGVARECKWPCLFSENFKPLQGKFSDVWIHGLEVNEALRAGELRIKSIRGYYYDAAKDKGKPALKAFVDHFYRLKQKAKDKAMRHMYKITQNAVYGKFIQTRKKAKISYTDVDSGETFETQELVAGGMFHPFIASAICAHTRVYIHRVEHAHKALHTATDGVFTYARRPRRIRGYPRSGLGSLSIEGRGDLLLVRNKCYILYGSKPADKDNPMPSHAFKGKFINKYAKHGFQASVYELEKLIAQNRRKYVAERPNRLKESLNRGLRVNKFERRPYTLKVAPFGVHKQRRKA